MELQVVWNGTMESQAIEAERRAPTLIERERGVQVAVLIDLQQFGESTVGDISARIERNAQIVTSAIAQLRGKGLVVVSDREPRITAWNKPARFYRAVEGV